MKNDFEEFLSEVHAEDYIGLDDDMPDSFDNWLSNLSIDEIINYANQYANTLNTCTRCTYSWYQRTPTAPRVCPKCKSPYWDKERVIVYKDKK